MKLKEENNTVGNIIGIVMLSCSFLIFIYVLFLSNFNPLENTIELMPVNHFQQGIVILENSKEIYQWVELNKDCKILSIQNNRRCETIILFEKHLKVEENKTPQN